MELLNIYGVLCAVVIGIVLGLTGYWGIYSYGTCISICIKYYSSNSYSKLLFIVGVTSFMGTLRNLRNHTINFNLLMCLEVPSLISVFLTRKYFVPYLPEIIYQTNSFSLSKDFLIMTFFALLMLFSSISMIRGVTYNNFSEKENSTNYFCFLKGL